jgi:hypothetical protein
MPLGRELLNRLLNTMVRAVLAIPVQDMTSGVRLCHHKAYESLQPHAQRFDLLIELLTHIHCEGCRVRETPFYYRRRQGGHSTAALLPFGLAFGRPLARICSVRNSLASADYDERAFSARIPIQRYWHRRRYAMVLGMLGHAERVLDIGWRSSKILETLPNAGSMNPTFRTPCVNDYRKRATHDARKIPTPWL